MSDSAITFGAPLDPARALGAAVVGSLLVHAAALFGIPQLDFSWLRTNATGGPPIEARIVPASPAPVPAAKSAVSPARPVAAARPKPRPAPPVGASPAMTIEAPEPPPAVNEQLRDRYPAAPPEEFASEDSREPIADARPPIGGAGAAAESAGPVADSSPPAALAVPPPDSPPPALAPAPPPVVPPAAPPILAEQPAVQYPLKRARLVYDLIYGHGGGIAGRVVHTLTIDNGHYFVETVAEATGVVSLFYSGRYVQRSRGHLGPGGFVPEEYLVIRGRDERTESAAFDWAGNRVTYRRGGESRTVELRAGVQDTVSMLHQFYFMQPFGQPSKLVLSTARKQYDSAYQILGEETITTPLGALRTIRIRRHEEDADRIDLWIDPERDYLPVRIYFEDRKRTVLEQVIREYGVERVQ